MRRAILYARQSDSRGRDDSPSTGDQVAALRARADAERWAVAGVFVDKDLRGWQDETERPDLARALAMVEAGGGDLFAVWDLSRLARSVKLLEDYAWRFARRNVELVSLVEPHADDDLVRPILAAVAQRQTRNLADNVRRGVHAAARRGRTVGPAPFGYRLAHADDGGPLPLLPDPDLAPFAVAAYERRAAGASVAEVLAYLVAAGAPALGPTGAWSWQAARNLLRNPAYRGAVRCGPVAVEDAHPALVPPDLWQAAQGRPPRRGVRAEKGAASWLEGLVDHGCGARMDLCRPQSTRPYAFFRCRTEGTAGVPRCAVRLKAARAARVEADAWAAVRAALAGLLPTERVVEALARRWREAAPGAGPERAAVERAIARAGARRARAEEAYLSGRRDAAWFAAEDDRHAAEVEAARARLAALPAPPDAGAIAAERARLADLAATLDAVLPADRGVVVGRLGRIAWDGGARLVPHPAVAPLLGCP